VQVPAHAVARYVLALTFAGDAVEAAGVAAWVRSLVAARVGDELRTWRETGAFIAR
jgi:hypothetical protein